MKKLSKILLMPEKSLTSLNILRYLSFRRWNLSQMYSLDFLYLFVTLFMSKYIYSQKQRSHGIYHSLLGTHIHINYNNLCVYICLYVCFVCVYVCWERLICALLNCPHLAICNISNLLYFHKIHIQNEPQITIIFLEIK